MNNENVPALNKWLRFNNVHGAMHLCRMWVGSWLAGFNDRTSALYFDLSSNGKFAQQIMPLQEILSRFCHTRTQKTLNIGWFRMRTDLLVRLKFSGMAFSAYFVLSFIVVVV